MPRTHVTTTILVAPRSGNFKIGETLSYYPVDGGIYSAVYQGRDGSGKSWILKDEHILSVPTYQLRR